MSGGGPLSAAGPGRSGWARPIPVQDLSFLFVKVLDQLMRCCQHYGIWPTSLGLRFQRPVAGGGGGRAAKPEQVTFNFMLQSKQVHHLCLAGSPAKAAHAAALAT